MAGGGGNNTTTTKQELSGQQKRILDLVMPMIKGTAKQGAQTYQGDRVAGFTPEQQQGRAGVVQAAQGPAQSIANSAAGGSNFLTSGRVLDPSSNPGLAGAIQAGIDPLRQEFQTTVMPQIRGDAILSGTYGGSEQAEATGLAGQNYLREVGNVSSQMANQNYQTGLDSMVRGLAIAPDTANLQMTPGAAIAGVGGQEQALEQARLDSEMQRWVQENYGDLLLAEQLAGVAFGMPLGQGVTEQSGGQVNPLLGGLGGAASGAAIGSLFGPGIGTGVGAGLGGLIGFLGS